MAYIITEVKINKTENQVSECEDMRYAVMHRTPQGDTFKVIAQFSSESLANLLIETLLGRSYKRENLHVRKINNTDAAWRELSPDQWKHIRGGGGAGCGM